MKRAAKGPWTKRHAGPGGCFERAGKSGRAEGAGPEQARRDARRAHEPGWRPGAEDGAGATPERRPDARARGQGQQAASFADAAADRIERLGGYLEQTSGERALAGRRGIRSPSTVDGRGLRTRRGPGCFPVPEGLVGAPLRRRSRADSDVVRPESCDGVTARSTAASRSLARATARAGEHGVEQQPRRGAAGAAAGRGRPRPDARCLPACAAGGRAGEGGDGAEGARRGARVSG